VYTFSVSIHWVSIRFVNIRFVSIRFVSIRFVSIRFVKLPIWQHVPYKVPIVDLHLQYSQILERLWGPLTTLHFTRCGVEPVTIGCHIHMFPYMIKKNISCEYSMATN
jgi:hypothetical protein